MKALTCSAARTNARNNTNGRASCTSATQSTRDYSDPAPAVEYVA